MEREGIEVPTKQFEGLQANVDAVRSRVAKVEIGGSSNCDCKSLYSQFNRLDPANKIIAIHGLEDTNFSNRLVSLEKILRESSGCPLQIRFDHIHRGKPDQRVVTKVTLVEFASNADREFVFKALKDTQLKDGTGAKIVYKRARTTLQKNRNDNLIKAEGLIKTRVGSSGKLVKIDWENRQVVLAEEVLFSQSRDSISENFFRHCSDLVL